MPARSLAAVGPPAGANDVRDAELGELVERMADPLLRLAARVMGDVAQAEDVLQDAWHRALVAFRAQKFEGRSSVETWLYRIVLTTALSARRQGARRSLLGPPSAPPPTAPGQPDARVALRELAALLDQLPEDQASALILKELEGLTTAEVAKTLECSEGAVEQRLVRARATLREKMS